MPKLKKKIKKKNDLKLLEKKKKPNFKLKSKIVNNLMGGGNKRTCEKILLKCLKNFQKLTSKNYKNIIKLAIKHTTPIFSIKEIKKVKKRRRNEIKIPFIPKENSRVTNSIKNIILETLKKKTFVKQYYKSLTDEFWLTAKKESEIIKKKTESQEQALKLKKRLARFRWF